MAVMASSRDLIGQPDVGQRVTLLRMTSSVTAVLAKRALDNERHCWATAVVPSSVTSALVNETVGNKWRY